MPHAVHDDARSSSSPDDSASASANCSPDQITGDHGRARCSPPHRAVAYWADRRLLARAHRPLFLTRCSASCWRRQAGHRRRRFSTRRSVRAFQRRPASRMGWLTVAASALQCSSSRSAVGGVRSGPAEADARTFPSTSVSSAARTSVLSAVPPRPRVSATAPRCART